MIGRTMQFIITCPLRTYLSVRLRRLRIHIAFVQSNLALGIPQLHVQGPAHYFVASKLSY